MASEQSSWLAKPFILVKAVTKRILSHYKKLKPAGKAFVWATIALYIAIAAVFIIFTPVRIFQWLYDFAHGVSQMRFGWLAFGAAMGQSLRAM